MLEFHLSITPKMLLRKLDQGARMGVNCYSLAAILNPFNSISSINKKIMRALFLLLLVLLAQGCTAPKTTYSIAGGPRMTESEMQRAYYQTLLARQIGPPIDSPLKLLSMVLPDYPQSLRQAGIQGTVGLRFVVDKEGTVKTISIAKSSSSLLGEIARNAVQQWRFEPITKSGQPVAQGFYIEFQFKLTD